MNKKNSINMERRALLLEGLSLEWQRLLPYVNKQAITSIYFGGGTPSLMGTALFKQILDQIRSDSTVKEDCEITLEANPEDITKPLIEGLKEAGVNRISLGVQSFFEPSLRLLERTHSSAKAREAVFTAFSTGMKNISIDLMYELPDQTIESFAKTLYSLRDLPIAHLSLYNLTIEPHTPFSKRPLSLPSEKNCLEMLQMATEFLENLGLKRYEISAFAKDGKISRHNIGYWTGRPFFGLGPSAFSYYKGSRMRNVPHLNRYLKALKNGKNAFDFQEKLSYPQNVHERLAVGLRVLEGVNLLDFELPKETEKILSQLIDEGFLHQKGNRLKLSEKGLLFYDSVASEIV